MTLGVPVAALNGDPVCTLFLLLDCVQVGKTVITVATCEGGRVFLMGGLGAFQRQLEPFTLFIPYIAAA